jgi:hypothetical protein
MSETLDFLRNSFGGKVRPVAEIREAGALAGFGWRSIQAASTRLGVGKTKRGMRGGWWWSVPAHEDTGAPHEDAQAGTAPSAEDTEMDGTVLPANAGKPADQTVARELVGLAVAALPAYPAGAYTLRAKRVDGDSWQIAIAARPEAGDTETASLLIRCTEAAVKSAFNRIGGAGRTRFESSADQLTGLLGRAQAFAHAVVHELAEERAA